MTYFHYYATTSRNLDRVLQYGVYPIAQCFGLVIGLRYFKHASKEEKERVQRFSSDCARWLSTGAYSLLTTAFLGEESQMIDHNAREAVSAELGIDPQQLSFSDYRYSGNAIIRKAHKDMMGLQKYRYGTDALFILPTLLRFGYTKGLKKEWPESDDITKDPFNSKYNWLDHFVNWHQGWNMSVYAGKAMYWAGETYLIEKSGHYEIVKLIETLESTGKDLAMNDLLGVYQRARTDRGLDMLKIDDAPAYDALRPLLQKMADAYNKHDGKFGIPEIIYLMGLNKINIFAHDEKTVSQDAISQSNQEIDKVLSIGLKEIRVERKKAREAHGLSDAAAVHSKNFLDRFEDGAVGIAQSLTKIWRRKPYRPEEYLSARNPGELSNYSYNR